MGGFHIRKKALFVSLWVETLIYGAYLVSFCFCVWILLRRRREGFMVFLSTALVIFAFSTFHVSLGFKMFISGALERNRGGAEEQRELHMTVFGLCGRNLAYVMNNFFTDALVVYRCYGVWNFNTYLIIIPCLLVLVTSMVGVNPIPNRFMQLRPEFFILSLVTNIMVTTMAAGRLWWIFRKSRVLLECMNQPALTQHYRTTFMIILESGAISSFTLIILITLRLNPSQHGSALIVQDAMAQIMGIVPTLIIVIVGLGKETNPQAPTEPMATRDSLTI